MRYFAVILASAMIVVEAARADAPQVYTFDNKHSDVSFTYDVGFVSQSGRFTEVGGTFRYAPLAPNLQGMDVVIKTVSLSANAFETELRSSDFFDVAVFPEIRFKSRSVKSTGGNSATLLGDLTMKGITQPLALKVVLEPTVTRAASNGAADSGMLRMTGVGRIKRSAFNMTALSYLVGDEIEIRVDATLKRG